MRDDGRAREEEIDGADRDLGKVRVGRMKMERSAPAFDSSDCFRTKSRSAEEVDASAIIA